MKSICLIGLILIVGIVLFFNITTKKTKEVLDKNTLITTKIDNTPTMSSIDPTKIDIIMLDVVAVSNANRYGRPPNGYSILCDGSGHYCVAKGDIVYDIMEPECMVRTNEKDAIILSWWLKHASEQPPQEIKLETSHYNWRNCDN